MRRLSALTFLLLSLVGAATLFASALADAVQPEGVEDEGQAVLTAEKKEDDVLEAATTEYAGDAPLPLLPELEDDRKATEHEGAVSPGKQLAVTAEQLVAKVFALGKAQGGRPPGTLTAVIGLVAFSLLMLMNSIMRYVDPQRADKSVMFTDGGRATAFGAAIIASLTIFFSGAVEAFTASRAASGLPAAFTGRGLRRAMLGRYLLLPAIVLLALGFLFGAPVFFMQLTSTTLWAVFTLLITGCALIIHDLRSGVQVLQQLLLPYAEKLGPLTQKPAADAATRQLVDVLLGKDIGDLAGIEQQHGAGGEQQERAAGAAGETPGEARKPAATDLAAAVLQQLQQEGGLLGLEDEGVNALVATLANVAEELKGNPEFAQHLEALQQQLGEQLNEVAAAAAAADAGRKTQGVEGAVPGEAGEGGSH